jgi:cytochrome c
MIMRSRHRLSTTSITVALVAMFGGGADAADAARGEHVYAPCAVCHPKDKTNSIGPGLLGVVGRQAGSAPGFRYSQAMKTSNIVWDEKSLDAFITAPQKALPGNVMPFAGLPDPQQRTDLIAYLETLK